MMEEVSDDTNGESSFEFVGGKIDENSSRDDNASLVSPEQLVGTTCFEPVGSPKHFSVPSSDLATPTFVTASQATVSNVKFYDIDSKGSQSVMLPPLITPGTSSQIPSAVTPSLRSQYPSVQYSYSPVNAPLQSAPLQSFQAPPTQQSFQAPPTQQSYSTPPTHHSTLNLPLEPAGAILESSSESGVWGWLKGKDFLNKVAEKAKSSVDSVITTLDPGMKEIINTGGDINVIVASGNEGKVSAIREAFQLVFGKAIVQGMAVQSSSIAPQPVGFSAGLKAAEERISNLKQLGLSQDKQILLSIENFLTELTPDNWFDMGCLLLQDQSSGINLQVFTEAIPVSSQYVAVAKDQTPPDYPLGWSGYAVTIGQIMGPALGVHHSQWHQALTGVSRREILFLAAKTLAGLYRSQVGR